MKKEKSIRLPAVGGSSLFVIFSVLCLTVFALLGLSTVLADKRLTEASADVAAAYYEADCMAEEILARLKNGEMPDVVNKDGEMYFYSCPISGTQQLVVEVIKDGNSWKVLRWQAVPETSYEEDTIPVWDGN